MSELKISVLKMGNLEMSELALSVVEMSKLEMNELTTWFNDAFKQKKRLPKISSLLLKYFIKTIQPL